MRLLVEIKQLTVWNKSCAVVSIHTSVHVLKKMTQHIDSRTCSYMSSQFACCVCVYRDDIGIPVCQFMRCRRHSSHSVCSVHKNKVQILCYFELSFPILLHVIFFSLSLCPFC